jgi:2'-5' RNA ligase
MLYILCYPKLAEADAAALEAFRAKHEPARAAMVGAHITLVFGVRQIEQAALIKLTRDIAATTGPFDFAIDGMEVEAHEHGDHNLMLKVGSGRETLIALNSTFYAGALAPERGTIEFVPHITIASNRDLKAVIMAAPEAKPLTTVKGRIEALDVAALSGATLTSLATIPLA